MNTPPTEQDDAATELLRAVSQPSPVTSRVVTLACLEGPDAGQTVTVPDMAHRAVLVGKSAACELRLTDPTVSRRHLSLELEDRGVVLRDLDSSNGTTVGGILVREAILRGGEIVKLGSTALRVDVGSEQSVVATSEEARFGSFYGASARVRRLYPLLERLAKRDDPVLLEGEAGTGKRLLAESLHERGPRREAPYLVLELRGMRTSNVDRVLFGEGAEPGIVEQAAGGTLVLSEISELDLTTQLKLARALRAGNFRRHGDTENRELSARIIATTSRELDRMVQDRAFREELLDVFVPSRIEVPPLRRRKGDVRLIAQLLWKRLGGDLVALSPAFLQSLDDHNWPGNVTELAEAVAEHLATGEAHAPGPDAGDAAGNFAHAANTILNEGLPFLRAREAINELFLRSYVRFMLERSEGNVSRAATAAGISRRYFHRLKRKV